MRDFMLDMLARHPEKFGPSEKRRRAVPPFDDADVYPAAEQLHRAIVDAPDVAGADDAVFAALLHLIGADTEVRPAAEPASELTPDHVAAAEARYGA